MQTTRIPPLVSIALAVFTLAFASCNFFGDPEQFRPKPKPEPEPAAEITGTAGIVLKYIPPGTFMMGSPEDEQNRKTDETQHQVTLTKGFYMGRYEVTQAQYNEITDNNPSYFPQGQPGAESWENHPVETVSWYDTLVFCNILSIREGLTPVYSIAGMTNPGKWGDSVPTGSNEVWNKIVWDTTANGYRLPTEAEWEYACRAGTSTAYNTGQKPTNVDTGWYGESDEGTTHEVGKKSINSFGLFDMHGNVWEWVWDWYGEYGTDAVIDPEGPSTGALRIFRGGSWRAVESSLRSANRYTGEPFKRHFEVGFRLARNVPK